MNEDEILKKIRTLTLNDDLPFENVLTQIVDEGIRATKTHRVSLSKRHNVLTYLRSLGITKAGTFEIEDDRIGLVPASQWYLHGVRSSPLSPDITWFVRTNGHALQLSTSLDLVPKKGDGKYYVLKGMLFIRPSFYDTDAFILPSPSFVRSKVGSLEVIDAGITITVSEPTNELFLWLTQ